MIREPRLPILTLTAALVLACELKPMNIGDEGTDGAAESGGEAGSEESGASEGGSQSGGGQSSSGGGMESTSATGGGQDTDGTCDAMGVCCYPDGSCCDGKGCWGSSGAEEGGSGMGTAGSDTDSGGEDPRCPPSDDFTCGAGVDCMQYGCGGPENRFDENGCLRPSCSSDEDCDMGSSCYSPLSGCASSHVACSPGPEGTCECVSTDDCGGRYCVPTEEVPPSCGGFGGFPCPDPSQVCADDPRDDCDPTMGGADCPGICRQGMPICTGKEPLDPYVLDDLRLEGDTLVLDVSSSGGCTMHVFSVCWDGSFLESDPVQVRLTVSHESFDDACEAWIQETVYQDLTGLAEAYRGAYATPHGDIVIGIVDQSGSVTYSF